MNIRAICRNAYGHENVRYAKDVSIHRVNIYCKYGEVNCITDMVNDPEDYIYYLDFTLMYNANKRSLIAKDHFVVPLIKECDPKVILDTILQEMDTLDANGTLSLNDIIGDYII